jgi:hypothetical protein
MSTEKQPAKFDELVAAKVAAGLPRKDAEEVAARQIAEDEAAEASAKKGDKAAKK